MGSQLYEIMAIIKNKEEDGGSTFQIIHLLFSLNQIMVIFFRLLRVENYINRKL